MTSPTVQSSEEQAFAAALPANGRPLALVFLQVGRETGVDPFVLAAVAYVESRFGSALNSGGTGDCEPRVWHSSNVPVAGAGVSLNPLTLGKPLYMPADGMCWGRGIMQIDYNQHYDWVSTNDWRNPTNNVRKAAAILQENLRVLQNSGVTGDNLVRGVLAAYNTGTGNVLASIRAGRDVDSTTAGGVFGNHNYSQRVLKAQTDFVAAFKAA